MVILSCSTEEIVEDIFDITPPMVEMVETESSNTLTIHSNEPISLITESFICNDITIIETKEVENRVEILLSKDLIPGKEYSANIEIEDQNGNYNLFITRFYGFNPRLPKVIINEFICKGTKTNPDKVELYVMEDGNLAGLTLYTGVKSDYDTRYVFTNINVTEGEYITVRSTSEKYPNEFIEIDYIDINHDKKFNPKSRDIRTNNLAIPGSNGVITIYDNPFGIIMDGIVYTKNGNDESKKYRNFGLSKTLERVMILEEEHIWSSETGEIFPEDSVNIDKTTTTRSANRRSLTDSNSNDDWYICPGGESSFGEDNSPNIY